MFIDMILKAIPRSFRAGVALVATIVFLGIGLQALTDLMAPLVEGLRTGWTIVQCVVGLLFGTIAGTAFYYIQAKDGSSHHGTGLDTIHAYHKDRLEEERLGSTEITPAYPPEDHHQKPSN